MDNNNNHHRKQESVFSKKMRAGKRRTYFFDVRRTKGDDFYLTLTESTKRFDDDGYERHKLFLYKEDFNRFLAGLEETIDYVKNELMPHYDYDEFTRRNASYEAQQLAEAEGNKEYSSSNSNSKPTSEMDSEEDISW